MDSAPLVLSPAQVPIEGSKTSHLLSAVRTAIDLPGRVETILYRRGEPLHVERLLPSTDDDVVGAMDVAREQGKIVVTRLLDGEERLHMVMRALCTCVEAGAPPRMFLYRRAEALLDRWLFTGEETWSARSIFSLPVVVDPAVPTGSFAICGSSRGPLVGDIELCVLCQVK